MPFPPVSFNSTQRVCLVSQRRSGSDTPVAYPLGYLALAALTNRREIFAALSPVTGLRSFNWLLGGEVEHIEGEMVGSGTPKRWGCAGSRRSG